MKYTRIYIKVRLFVVNEMKKCIHSYLYTLYCTANLSSTKRQNEKKTNTCQVQSLSTTLIIAICVICQQNKIFTSLLSIKNLNVTNFKYFYY